MSNPNNQTPIPDDVRFVSYMESTAVADLLEWLGNEVAAGRILVRENGDEWVYEVRGAVRGAFEASCRGHSGKLRLRLNWEEPAHGPLAIIAE